MKKAFRPDLLHDVVEDTLVDLDTLRTYFGDEITGLVDGLTKIAHISNLSKEKQQAENVRKMVLAMITDVRVVLIKLADRLHNMRTMQYLKPEKRARISQETLDIYAPIAHRLGMGKMRGELEDLSFQNLYPEEYKRLSKEVESRRSELEDSLEKITQTIREKLEENEVPYIEIEGRVKRLFSLWKKLKKRKLTIEEVYDLIAARIITANQKKNCYLALSVIHDIWTPVPERFKDWIAIPRENLYQSLHTSVIGDGGQAFEVQIRTEEMHQIAEEGVAAHWKYKENKLGTKEGEENLDELRKTVEKLLLPLVETTENNDDSEDFIESLKLDLYPKRSLHIYADGKSHRTSERRNADRLCLCDSLGSRRQLAPARKSTVESCRSEPNCKTAILSKSSRQPILIRREIGSITPLHHAPEITSGIGFPNSNEPIRSKSVAVCSKKKLINSELRRKNSSKTMTK